MKNIFMCFFVSFLAAGCTPKNEIWYKDGGTAQKFEKDKNICIYEAEKAIASKNFTTGGILFQSWKKATEIDRISRLCLRTKGYSLQTQTQ